MKGQNYELLGNTPDLHLVNLAKTDSYFDQENKIYKYPIIIQCEAKFINFNLNWSLEKNTVNGKLLDVKYRDAFLKFTEFYNNDIKASQLPILAFFSDSYPHKKNNIGSYAKSILRNGKFTRAFAYYQWDADANCAEIWQNRYIAQYSKILDFKNDENDTLKEKDEIEFIDNNTNSDLVCRILAS